MSFFLERVPRSSMETDAAHVSAMLRTPGVISYLWTASAQELRWQGGETYLSIHCSTAKGSILTILGTDCLQRPIL